MSTISEHQANENTPEVSPQSTTTLAQLHEALQHFDILSSRAEKHIFTYAYLYLIGFFLLGQLWRIPKLRSRQVFDFEFGGFTYLTSLTSLEMLFVIGVCLILWTFNVWRKSVPRTLRAIIEKHCISVHTGDLNEQYLDFLKNYRDALRNPRRYLLSIFLIGSMAIYIIYNYAEYFHNDFGVRISGLQQFIVVTLDLAALFAAIIVEIGFMYCLGILFWSLLISGQYIRNLARMFEFRIEPVHPDNCGGLHMLGNFCFASTSPIPIGSIFYIGWLLIAAYFFPLGYNELGLSTVALIFFVILLFGLPVIIFAFVRPLWSIHTNMLRKREKDDDHYVEELMTLRENIQVLLDANDLIEAKNMKEKKELKEALYIPYPTWPFSFRSKIFTAFLGASGSLTLGVLTALVPPFIQAIITGKW